MKALIFIFLFIFFVSGLLFVYRMLSQLARERILDKTSMTKIGTSFVLLNIVIASTVPTSLAVLVIGALNLLVLTFPPLIMRLREHHFKKMAFFMIDEIVLGMKAGR